MILNINYGNLIFMKLGWTWKTRFSKEPSSFYFKYGVSFLWNNLRLKDNKFMLKMVM